MNFALFSQRSGDRSPVLGASSRVEISSPVSFHRSACQRSVRATFIEAVVSHQMPRCRTAATVSAASADVHYLGDAFDAKLPSSPFKWRHNAGNYHELWSLRFLIAVSSIVLPADALGTGVRLGPPRVDLGRRCLKYCMPPYPNIGLPPVESLIEPGPGR